MEQFNQFNAEKQTALKGLEQLRAVLDELGEMGGGLSDDVERVERPRAHGIHHGVEALEVFLRELEDILLHILGRLGAVVTTTDGGHVETTAQRLFNNSVGSLSVGCDYCDFFHCVRCLK